MNPRDMVQHYAATIIAPEHSAVASSAKSIFFLHPVNTGSAVWNEVVRGMKRDRPIVVPDCEHMVVPRKWGLLA
jgi:hypothetical protein